MLVAGEGADEDLVMGGAARPVAGRKEGHERDGAFTPSSRPNPRGRAEILLSVSCPSFLKSTFISFPRIQGPFFFEGKSPRSKHSGTEIF